MPLHPWPCSPLAQVVNADPCESCGCTCSGYTRAQPGRCWMHVDMPCFGCADTLLRGSPEWDAHQQRHHEERTRQLELAL